jgi:hypothetical protein
MPTYNLGRRLVAELRRGGKRSVVLGLLVLVGLYYWIPLFWRLIVPARLSVAAVSTADQPGPAAAMPPVNGDRPKPATVSSAAKGRAHSDWVLLGNRLQQAHNLQPVELDDLVRDPFSQDWLRERQASLESGSDTALLQAADPIKTFVCSGTLVGPHVRAAVIGDHVYQVGDLIPSEGPVRYLVKDILRDKVLLEREGNTVAIPIQPAVKDLMQ